VISQYSKSLAGLLLAGALTLPVVATTAAPKKPAPKKPAAGTSKGDAAKGKMLYKSEGCTGCHKSKDYPTAGEVGPDLSAIGKEKKAAEIAAYIKHPKKDSVMPAFKGPQKTVDDVTAYLLTQK
jgi:mono/diheme cytochrome c family protein